VEGHVVISSRKEKILPGYFFRPVLPFSSPNIVFVELISNRKIIKTGSAKNRLKTCFPINPPLILAIQTTTKRIWYFVGRRRGLLASRVCLPDSSLDGRRSTDSLPGFFYGRTRHRFSRRTRTTEYGQFAWFFLRTNETSVF
jgi:hypothetical protein